MSKGGYRAGGGRPRGAKDSYPRKGTEARAEAEKIKAMLAMGIKAKQRFYQEFFIRIANKDGLQKPLSLAEKKFMGQLAIDIAAERDEGKSQEDTDTLDPLTYMLRVMNDPKEDKEMRARMAQAAAPYIHPKAGEGGKKEEKTERAAVAAKGKFAAGRAPIALVK